MAQINKQIKLKVDSYELTQSCESVPSRLLIDYEQCIAKASRGTGCDEDAEMRVQIMSFSDIMRDEYKDSCPTMVYKNAPEAPEAFEDYEEDWADSDPYWYDSKDGSPAQGTNKARRVNARIPDAREDRFGNVQERAKVSSALQNNDPSKNQQRALAKQRIFQVSQGHC